MEDFVKPLSKVVYDIINQEALKLNLMIEEIAWVREHNHNYLRIIADSKVGLSIDQCSALNEAISNRLDIEDPISEEYILEVSSPGLERPLKKEADFLRFLGSYIYLKTYQSINGKKEFYGTLNTYTKEAITITTIKNNKEFILEIKHEQISQIRLAVKF